MVKIYKHKLLFPARMEPKFGLISQSINRYLAGDQLDSDDSDDGNDDDDDGNDDKSTNLEDSCDEGSNESHQNKVHRTRVLNSDLQLLPPARPSSTAVSKIR